MKGETILQLINQMSIDELERMLLAYLNKTTAYKTDNSIIALLDYRLNQLYNLLYS